MKRYSLYTLITLLWAGVALGQGDPCPDSVGISTDPRPGMAYNNERGSSFFNHFNWMDSVYSPTWFASGTPYAAVTSIPSPFFGHNNYYLNYLAKRTGSDFYPEDGWELIHWGMGKKLDGSNYPTAHQIPYLILYNRHSGMLHVFGISYLTGYKVYGIELELTKKDPALNRPNHKPNGLFGYYQPEFAQVLDQPTTVRTVRANFPFSNQYLHFAHAAFPLAYDPCVCHDSSAIQLWFHAVDSSNIDLYGRLQGTSTTVENYAQASGVNGTFHPDWLNSVTADGLNNVVAGMQVYRQAAELYDELMGQMTGEVDILVALDKLKAQLELGAEILSPWDIPEIEIGYSYPLKVAAKAINYQQAQIKLARAGEAKPALALPALMRGEMVLSGKIVDEDDQLASEIAVPGSKESWLLPEADYMNKPYYPLYNEELGVFALLETPVIERYRAETELLQAGDSCFEYGVFAGRQDVIEETFTYRIKDPLTYALNPAARVNVEESDISVAIGIRSWPSDAGGSFAYSFSQELGNLEAGVGDYTYFSPFVPVACLEDLTVSITRSRGYCMGEPLSPPSTFDTVYIRFANTYLSSTLGRDSLPILSQQILTFPVILETVTTPLPSSPIIPFELALSGTLTGDVQAWREITVDGDLSASSPVTVSAGTSITVLPDVELSPNISLVPGVLPIACGSPNPPQTPAQLEAYCTSTQYRANDLSRLGRQYLAQAQARDALPLAPSLTAFPNPFDETITLRYDLPAKATVSLVLYDMLGRPVRELLPAQAQAAGMQEHTFDTHMLPAGLYQVIMQAGAARTGVKVVRR